MDSNSLQHNLYKNVAAVRDMIQKNLDNLVASPGRTNIEARGDAIGIISRLRILSAMNSVDFTEILEASRMSASFLETATGLETFNPSHLVWINNAGKVLENIEATVARIRSRYDMIQKLEQRFRTHDNVRIASSTVPAGRETEDIHWDNAIFQTPHDSHNQGHQRLESPNLVDMEVLPPIDTPVLQPVSTSPSTAASTAAPTPSPAEDGEAESAVIPRADPRPRNVFRNAYERIRTMYQHRYFTNLSDPPLVFQYGVQYAPPSPFEQEDQSRMVIFSGLREGTTCRELLDHVRGGQILRIARANSTTTLVYFVNGVDARAYVQYINDPAHRPLQIQGAVPHVHLAPTPSYPLRQSLILNITRYGVTRCLGFPYLSTEFQATVTAFFARKGIWGWTEGQHTEFQNSTGTGNTHDNDDSDDNRHGPVAPELAEEWVVLDDNGRLRGNLSRRLVSFRDITFAQYAYYLVRVEFPRCGVYYAPDRCAGPLSELDSYLSN